MTELANKTAILILGAHRSGTSALTRMISLLGYDLPQNLMTSLDGNEAGHWESEALAQMNDSILEELNLAWYEWHPYRLDQIGSKRKATIVEDVKSVLQKEYPSQNDCVIKDPRVCRLTEFVIPAIKQMPADLKIIIPFRNPLEVMASLEKRNGLSKPQAALIWLRYVLDAEIGSRGEDRAFIPYEDYLNAPQKTMSSLCKTLKLKPKNSVTQVKKQLQAFIRNDLKHHNYDHDLLLMEPTTRGWVSETVKNLMVLKDDPTDKGALESLDAIRLQFGQVTPILKASLDALYLAQEAKIKEQKDKLSLEQDEKIKILQEKLDEQHLQKEQIEGELSQLTGTLAHRNTEILEEKKSSTEEIKQLHSERSILNETIERVETEKKKHQEDYEKLSGEHESLLEQDEALRKSNQELQSHIETVEAEKKKHQEDYEKLSGEHESLLEQDEALRKSNQELQSHIETVEAEKKKHQEDYAKLSGEHEKLEGKFEHFHKEHNLLLEEYERLAQERSTLRETIGRIDSEKKKHQQDYVRLSNEYENILKHRESLEQKNQTLEERTELLETKRQDLFVKIQKIDAEKKTLFQQLEESQKARQSFEREHNSLLKTKDFEITGLVTTKTGLEDEIHHVRERLKQEQRTVIKPLLRRVRGAGGFMLRIFLPNRWVDGLALMAPTAEQKLLIEQHKVKALNDPSHTPDGHSSNS